MTSFDHHRLSVDESWLAGCRVELQPLHDLLSGPGIERGLVGPREADRLWDRHLLNCAAPVAPALDLVPAEALVADIGSGAGLPGLVWAIVRPDVRVVLIEPLQRRTAFLEQAVDTLGLSARVTVRRGRAQDLDPQAADVVTSRAVAAMAQLLGWCWPHVRPGGEVLAIKGGKAADELVAAGNTVAAMGATQAEVVQVVSEADQDPPLATLVRVCKEGSR